ncbi:MAG TPA: endonuclease/exonuclease/phosphatase family protein [Rhizobacter sp.]
MLAWLEWGAFGLGALMLVATALPLLRKDDWWIRVFDFPRLQITVLTGVAFAAILWMQGDDGMGTRVLLALLGVAFAYQCYRMRPFTRLARPQVQMSRRTDPDTRLSLLFSNVLMGNRKSARLLELIREADPDIVLAVETDAWWQDELRGLERTHPHTVQQPQDNTYGMLLYSRLPLRNAEVKFLVQDDVPSIHACVLLPNGEEVELRCLHPRPPAPGENDRSTERDAELLIVGREIKQRQRPVVVFGDLNDVAWSHTNDLFKNISGLLDPRVGRGFFHTFNAKWPLVRWPLDHCFHSPHFRLVDFRRLPACGSDHFPVYIRLSYEPDAEAEQPHPHADAAERQEAQEKVAEV